MSDTPSPLDLAHAAMEAAPEDDRARLRYYQVLADTELCLLLQAEALGDQISPETFDLGELTCVLAFDTEDRLAQFVGRPAPYAALSGRVLAGMLAEQGLGLGVNLETPQAFLLDADGLRWLVDTLAGGDAQTGEARIVALHPPGAVPAVVLDALAEALTRASGLAEAAFFVQAEYDSGMRGPLVAVLNASDRAQAPLAKSLAEALVFSGMDAAALDVTFVADGDPRLPALRAHALRLDIPAPSLPEARVIEAPGSDPAKPPKLR